MTQSKIYRVLAILLFCSFAMTLSAAELRYNGILNNSEGQIVADGAHVFDFTIFTAPTDGMAVWAESHDDVYVEDGAYSLILGSRTALDLPAGTFWVEVTVDGEVLEPRVKVLLGAGDCTITGNLSVDGNIGIGTAAPAFPLHIDQGDVASGFRTYYGPECSTCFGEFKQARADGLIINSSTGGSFAEIRFQRTQISGITTVQEELE